MKTYDELYKETMESIPKEFHNGVIFLTLHGSHAYGTATPDSDYDIRGVLIAPRKYYTGYLHRFEHFERTKPYDISIFELQKFCKLAADANPNILELLFIPRDKWLFHTPAWERLVNNRHLFLSKKCKFTFSGYAVSQLKRIKNHYHWINIEEPQKPMREEYGLPPTMKLTVSEEQVVHKLLQNDVFMDPQPVRDYITKEQRYREAFDKWETWTIWKAHRNPYRHDLEERYGYDTKHALHLIRLMRMCKEILTEGTVLVTRPDATELLEIKNGKMSYEELIQWAEELDASLDTLYQTSSLQKEPSRVAIDALCQELIERSILKELGYL